MAKPIPDGYHSLTPYLVVNNAASAIDFYKRAFGAIEFFRMDDPSGRIGHAELQIGDSRLMLADEYPEQGFTAPATPGKAGVTMHLYVENVDAVFNQAVAAGAKAVRPLENQFYGDRTGSVVDPFGHSWYLATHVEDLTEEEMGKRAAAAFAGKSS